MKMKKTAFHLLLFIPSFLAPSCHKPLLSRHRLPAGNERDFVVGISDYAKTPTRIFAVIPQNGIELANSYIASIDGVGQEDLFRIR